VSVASSYSWKFGGVGEMKERREGHCEALHEASVSSERAQLPIEVR